VEKGYLEQKTGDGCIGEEEGEMPVGEAGNWDRKDMSTFRERVSDSGEGSSLHIEHS
jgi:hypothetical protein